MFAARKGYVASLFAAAATGATLGAAMVLGIAAFNGEPPSANDNNRPAPATAPAAKGAADAAPAAGNVADTGWPGSPQRREHETALQMKTENVAEMVVSARDALECARTGNIPERYTAAQRRLVSLVSDAQKIPLGREMTKMAADRDVWYAIDNHVHGGGYYSDSLRLVALELCDDGTGDGHKRDYAADADFEAARAWFQEALYHELAHFYQYQVWHNSHAPAGTRSFDAKLWDLSIESQADLVAGEALRQHRLTKEGKALTPPVSADLRKSFTDDILNGSHFHRLYYQFAKASFTDGAAVDPAAYAAAFGRFPGKEDNFLTNSIGTHSALYGAVVWPDAQLRKYYEDARQKIGAQPAPATLASAPTPGG